MKKNISIILIVILLSINFVGCSKSEGNDKLTIGLMPSVDAIPFIIAEEKNYYEENGVNVELQIFKSAKDRDAALQSGSLDGIIGDQVAITLYQNADFDVKITSFTDGDFILIAGKDSGVTSIEDVVNKSVAISENTVIEYALDTMLQNNGIDTKNINKTVISAIPTRVEMLNNGRVDLALLPEPFATLAINSGGVVIDKATNNGLLPSVIAFKKETIDEKNEGIKNFFKAYDEAIEYLNTAPMSEYEDIVINTVGYPEELKGEIELGSFSKHQLPSNEELENAILWTENKGLSKKELSPEDLIYSID